MAVDEDVGRILMVRLDPTQSTLPDAAALWEVATGLKEVYDANTRRIRFSISHTLGLGTVDLGLDC
jgi:hypothetical protein